MSSLVELSKTPKDNLVDFLIDYTNKNYVKLEGLNNPETIKIVYSFLVRYNCFERENEVYHKIENQDYCPGEEYHDFSCVLNFYDLMYRTYQKLNKLSETEKTVRMEITPEMLKKVQLNPINLELSESLENVCEEIEALSE